MSRATFLIAILLASGLPIIVAATDTTGCTIHTYAARQMGDYYNYAVQELWEESNGVPGLQRYASFCSGREPLPRDTCITHMENFMLITCLGTYPGTLP